LIFDGNFSPCAACLGEKLLLSSFGGSDKENYAWEPVNIILNFINNEWKPYNIDEISSGSFFSSPLEGQKRLLRKMSQKRVISDKKLIKFSYSSDQMISISRL
jgi:hypothetical protein